MKTFKITSDANLNKIFNWYVRRFLIYKPHGMPDKEFLEEIFYTKYRRILRFQANEQFVLPGELYVSPTKTIEGLGHRLVRMGAILVIRKDCREDYFDVEYQVNLVKKGKNKHIQSDQVFKLTPDQWKEISRKVTEIPWGDEYANCE